MKKKTSSQPILPNKTGCTKEIDAGGFPNVDAACKILEACALYGVAELKMPGLEAVFFATVGGVRIQPGAGPTIPPAAAEKTIRAQARAEEASIEEQELATREDQIAELILTDPLRAEELMMEGEVIAIEGDDGGDDGE